MADDKLIEVVDLLFDFQYTIPGSKKNAVFLRAGERFRLLEKKSENWYLVLRLETDESFFVPVLYSELVKLPSKKPSVVPPKLPVKPKNLLEKLQNDLEINPPSPPVIEDSVQIELFKLLSILKPKKNSTNSYYFKKSLHKSDSHVDQIPHNTEGVDFKSIKKKEEDIFNSLPKASPQHSRSSESSPKSLSLHVSKVSPLSIHQSPKSLSLPRHEIPPKPPISPKHSKTQKFTFSPKLHLKSQKNKNPPSSPTTTPKLNHPEQNFSPTTPTTPIPSTPTPTTPNKPLTHPTTYHETYQIYKDEVTGHNYYYNPLTNESTWILPEGEGVKGENKHELSMSSNESYPTGSLEMLKNSSDEDRPNLSKSGPLNRTKLTEGGRKLKKYWYCTFAVLEANQLSFYKDQKSSHHRSRADLSIDLSNSFVLKGGTANKQNLIQVITNTSSEYLLQSNDQSEVQQWFELLSAASSLVTAATTDVTKALSNEDLNKNTRFTDSSADEVPNSDSNHRGTLTPSTDKSRLVEKLRMWLSKRPTQDSLREKGIYKEALFGSSLELICEREGCMVPSFVINCMRAVEERGLQVDGIYRISGNMADIQKLRMAVDSNSTYNLTDTDIHTVSGALKMFLRELQQPLIPFNHYYQLLGAYFSPNKVDSVRGIIKCFPETNYETLKTLLRHLLLVVSHCSENRMQITNLSIIFGPTLLWPEDPVDPTKLASSLMARGQLVELLLIQFPAIFA